MSAMGTNAALSGAPNDTVVQAPSAQALPPPTAPQATILSGAPSGTAANPDENFAPGPLSGNTGIKDAGATPAQGGGGNPISPTNPQTDELGVPLKANGQPSVWKDIVIGALAGLAGSAGAKHFGSGLAGGAEGYANKVQQVQQNKDTAQKLNFQSLEAANSAIAARNSARAADDAHDEHAQQLAEQSLIYQQTMKALGITPTTTIASDNSKDMHAGATGALTTLAQRNGGTIPVVATTNDPATGDKKTHEINVYAPNAGDITKNPNGYRTLVDEVSKIQNGSPVPDIQWTSGGGEMLGKVPNPAGGQQKMVMDAHKFLLIPPMPADDKDGNKAASIQATLDQQLKTYQADPNANPDILKALQAKTDGFRTAAKDAQDHRNEAEANNIAVTAPAQAGAAMLKKNAEDQTASGQAAIALSNARKASADTTAQKNQQEIDMNTKLLGQTDGFGNHLGLPGDTGKDVKTKTAKFQTAYVQPLDQLAKTNMEFTRISNDPNMTPAEKVTGLLAAVGISFDPLKGKGARMTQSVIGEHAESRSIYQGAIAKLDNLVPGGGGPITASQVKDYAAIAQGVVHDAYITASWRAQEQGLDSTSFLPHAQMVNGKAPIVDPTTAKIYLDAAHGDKNKAFAALKTNGFAQ